MSDDNRNGVAYGLAFGAIGLALLILGVFVSGPAGVALVIVGLMLLAVSVWTSFFWALMEWINRRFPGAR